jgi:hypothetical protein
VVASRLSTDGGVKAKHWVKGEEGGIEGGVSIGIEAGKRRRRQHRGRD